MRDFWTDKSFTTRQSGCRVQVWVQVLAPACHLAITPEGYSTRQSKVVTAKSIAELEGHSSGTAWAGRTGEHKHREFPSQLQLLLAAAGSLEEEVLYWLSSRVKLFCKFWAVTCMTTDFFLMWNEIFNGVHKILLLTKAALIALLNLFFFSWSLTKNNSYIVNGILCKTSGLKQLYVWETGVCSDSNQTAQQLQMEVCKSLETISGMILNWFKQKFAVKWVAKWNAMAESSSETSTDCQWTSLIVTLTIFWDICYSKNHLLYYWPPITQYLRSVLNFKLSVLTFLRSMSCLMSIEQKSCKDKKI